MPPGAANRENSLLHVFSILIPVLRISASQRPVHVQVLSDILNKHHRQAPYIVGRVRPKFSDHQTGDRVKPIPGHFG